MREVTRLCHDCMRRTEGDGCTHWQIQTLIGPLHRVGRFPCSLISESTDPFCFSVPQLHETRVTPRDRTITFTELVHSSLVQFTTIATANQTANGSVEPKEHRAPRSSCSFFEQYWVGISALRKVVRLVFLVFHKKGWESANIADCSATRNQQGCWRTQPMEPLRLKSELTRRGGHRQPLRGVLLEGKGWIEWSWYWPQVGFHRQWKALPHEENPHTVAWHGASQGF